MLTQKKLRRTVMLAVAVIVIISDLVIYYAYYGNDPTHPQAAQFVSLWLFANTPAVLLEGTLAVYHCPDIIGLIIGQSLQWSTVALFLTSILFRLLRPNPTTPPS
jgi:hypothetical protein